MTGKIEFRDIERAIGERDLEFLDRQQADLKKTFAPPVALRFASCVQGRDVDRQIERVNRIANRSFWEIWEHPDLQWRLIAASGCGHNRHLWLPLPNKARSSSKVHQLLSKYWPDANSIELDLILSKFTRETYHDFISTLGMTPADVAEAIAEYDAFLGVKSGGRKKKAKT